MIVGNVMSEVLSGDNTRLSCRLACAYCSRMDVMMHSRFPTSYKLNLVAMRFHNCTWSLPQFMICRSHNDHAAVNC